MSDDVKTLETQLNGHDAESRRRALAQLIETVLTGKTNLPKPHCAVNLHCHTTYSYNGYGYSPSYLAWKARQQGLYAAGIVDFDVLDAVDEFLAACRTLGLRGCAGVETRVFIPQYETQELNSPGEPGIAYVVGVGFTPGAGKEHPLIIEMAQIAQERNRAIAARVNPFLEPATIDYDADVLPLTPAGNATERHLCAAYDLKAQTLFPDPAARAQFWAEKLNQSLEKITAILDNAPALQTQIRAKTMKSGGVGYVKPNGPEFPSLERFNAFTLECGAIPTYAFLDGTSAGEADMETLLTTMTAQGAAGITIIPDRNWNIKDPTIKQMKVEKMHHFAHLVHERGLPLFCGTEMNAYGQRFIDDFDTPELHPLLPLFIEGANIAHAHTILQAREGKGYLSPWAAATFTSIEEKNRFFNRAGEQLDPVVLADTTAGEQTIRNVIAAAK